MAFKNPKEVADETKEKIDNFVEDVKEYHVQAQDIIKDYFENEVPDIHDDMKEKAEDIHNDIKEKVIDTAKKYPITEDTILAYDAVNRR